MAVSRRRLLVLGAALAALPLHVFPQPKGGARPARIGFLASTSPLAEITGPRPANPFVRSFMEGLHERGYVEGRNLVLFMRTLGGKADRLDAVLAEFAREKLDVVFLPSPYMVPRATKVAPQLPIVAFVGPDLLDQGIIRSLARPGGMVTGPSMDIDEQVEVKRVELMLELKPGIKRMAYIGTRDEWARRFAEQIRRVASERGIEVIHLESDYADFGPAFARLPANQAEAVFIERSPRAYGRREQIGALAVRSGIPSICSQSEIADHGCLLAYGADNVYAARRIADYMDRILKGARPGDLPVEAPTKYELVINLKTARTIGVNIPQVLRLRADRVIE